MTWHEHSKPLITRHDPKIHLMTFWISFWTFMTRHDLNRNFNISDTLTCHWYPLMTLHGFYWTGITRHDFSWLLCQFMACINIKCFLILMNWFVQEWSLLVCYDLSWPDKPITHIWHMDTWTMVWYWINVHHLQWSVVRFGDLYSTVVTCWDIVWTVLNCS